MADPDGWQKRGEWKKVYISDYFRIRFLTILSPARFTLARLHANGNIDDPFVNSQIEDMKADIYKARDIGESRLGILLVFDFDIQLTFAFPFSWKELFTVPSNFRRLSLGLVSKTYPLRFEKQS